MLIVPNSHPKGQICLRLVDGRTELDLSLKTLFMSQRMVRLLRVGEFDPIPMQCIN